MRHIDLVFGWLERFEEGRRVGGRNRLGSRSGSAAVWWKSFTGKRELFLLVFFLFLWIVDARRAN